MATTTFTGYANGRWTYGGTQFDGNNSIKKVTPQSGSSIYVRTLKVVESVNSPNYWRKVEKMVTYVPRKNGKKITPPRIPFLRLPTSPYPRPRRKDQTERSYQRGLASFRRRDAAHKARVKLLEAAFALRQKKYLERLKKFEEYQAKLRNGVLKKVRRPVQGNDLQWNAFSSVQDFDTGDRGSHSLFSRQWVYFKPVESSVHYGGDLTSIVNTRAGTAWPTAQLNELRSNALTSAESIALNRLHERLTGEQVHLANVLAERAQTVKLLSDSATRLVKFLLNFTPGKLFRTVTDKLSLKGSRQVADDYLAFKFGAEPLMDDVKGAAEAVAHFAIDKLVNNVKVTGSAKKSGEETVVVIRNGNQQWTFTQRTEVHVRYVCEYGVDNVLVREMSKLGLINPTEILWELTPWSFVVDWILPVGNYIRHLSNNAGLVFIRGTRSTRTVVITSLKVTSIGAIPYNPVYWGTDNWSTSDTTRTIGTISKYRTLLEKSPYPQVPSFKNPFSATHLMEGLALLRQKLKS